MDIADNPMSFVTVDPLDAFADDCGAQMMLDRFADCVMNGTPVPVSFGDAANWTAAGLLSADSVNLGSVPIDVPEF